MPDEAQNDNSLAVLPIHPVASRLPNLAPRSFEDVLRFADLLAKSSFVPQSYAGKAGDIVAAIVFGNEVGLSAMQSLQNIAVINGRPCLWGDAMLGLVQASGLLEYIKETDDGTCATCEVKRRGDKEICAVQFSDKDAQAANLLTKSGPWTQYRPRMRKLRARGFALRDKFADVLKGLITREEAEDYPTSAPTRIIEIKAPQSEETPSEGARTPPSPPKPSAAPPQREPRQASAPTTRGSGAVAVPARGQETPQNPKTLKVVPTSPQPEAPPAKAAPTLTPGQAAMIIDWLEKAGFEGPMAEAWCAEEINLAPTGDLNKALLTVPASSVKLSELKAKLPPVKKESADA